MRKLGTSLAIIPQQVRTLCKHLGIDKLQDTLAADTTREISNIESHWVKGVYKLQV
jgi:hypothetical protein